MTTDTQHTPGPWNHQKMLRLDDRIAYVVNGAPDPHTDLAERICDTPIATWSHNAEADARLMASAPDLLEALEELTEAIRDLGRPGEDGEDRTHCIRNEWMMKLLTRCEHTIAKAEGRG